MSYCPYYYYNNIPHFSTTEDKNDPASHSGSESSASEELSQHSTSNITSSSSTSNSAGPIIAAFANSANGKSSHPFFHFHTTL